MTGKPLTVGAVLAACGYFFWLGSKADPPDARAGVVVLPHLAVPQPTVQGQATSPKPVSAAPAPSVTAAAAPSVALGSGETPDLRADASGNLVEDAHTRDELERLIALNDRSGAQALLERLEGSLPPTAYRRAVDAFYAYQNYAIAAAQLTSPSQPVQTETEATRQLDALHALRVEHFGPILANAYFGDEEATARRLLDDMRSHPERGATLAERASKAEAADAEPPR